MKQITMFVWNNFVNDARVLREATALTEMGYVVTVIAKKEMDEQHLPAAETVAPGVIVNRPLKLELPKRVQGRIKSGLLNKHIPNMLAMLKMMALGRSRDADVYHSHDLNTLLQGIASAKLRRDRKPLIYDSHEVQTSRTHYSFRKIYRIEKFLLKFVDHVIVENDTRADYHRRLYRDRPTPVHNYSEFYDVEAVETYPIREEFSIPGSEKIVLYQGGMQEGRGLFKLLDAFKEVEGARLIMIGDGKERLNLIDHHRKLGLEHKVHFIQRVPYKELRRYTKAADVGIQFLENTNFNHYSASSNKLFEYIMAHVPVIGSKLPEIEAVIEGEQAGLTVEPESTRQLKEAIQKLVDRDALRNTFRENTKQAKLKYNWNNEKDVLKRVYRRID
ncbi:MAG TPA: glycosyltransferase family 4 protein [Candidatus Salinicoccus stercoripullorum]|uniref:Glycosyltransferase family 4 protein n=1 Tax=Candidatus Salinicoccus stercoripullorum TaxID=2838756 RepID=A0A9D1QFN7_9STAP|nr:glycosyltransferase family 4 protein [Candidatus Salinicoccus stercoripullorum]